MKTLPVLALLAGAIVVTFGVGPAQAQSGYEPYYFATLAGLPPGAADGNGSAARFRYLQGIATDTAGNMYVADRHNHSIRKITPTGMVSTFAGASGVPGHVDGEPAAARFRFPTGVAYDSAGNLLVADAGNQAIRKITPDGTVSTFTGGIAFLSGIAIDALGNVYVTADQTVRKITPAGVITTLAGTPGMRGYQDGYGGNALFDDPAGIAVHPAGGVLVADTNNHRIRFVNSEGYAGVYSFIPFWNGTEDGVPYAFPSGVMVNSASEVYIVDTGNSTIRKISPDGSSITTIAGSGLALPGNVDGTGTAARFSGPTGVAQDPSGNLWVADRSNATVRKINAASEVSTAAGLATRGFDDGSGSAARFSNPHGVAVDSAGNIYVADTSNCTIRKTTPAGAVTTLAGSPLTCGNVDGAASAARFRSPNGVAVDNAGNVYVADTFNSSIRKITPAGDVSTVAVLSYVVNFSTRYDQPEGLVVDGTGNLYVAATASSCILKISPAGTVTTFAGSRGVRGSANGSGTTARFNRPSGIALDSAGNLFVADTYNNSIRKITPAAVVSTLAPGPFFQTRGVATDGAGNVYFTVRFDGTVRKISPAGAVSLVAGDPNFLYQSADGLGTAARFWNPSAIASDGTGRLYVADATNNTIRVGELPLVLTSVVSRKTHGSAGTFDINLPLASGSPAVECRSGGVNRNHTFVFTFNHDIASGNAAVTMGLGSVTGNSLTISNNQVSVDLTGVDNAQMLTVTLTGVTDSLGQTMADTAVTAAFLQGDTNGNGTVNATDIGQTKSASGQTVTSTNFRTDVSASGSINATDIGIVKSASGTSLPAASAIE